VIFIALPLQDHNGSIFYKKYVVARKCLRNGCVNPECRLEDGTEEFSNIHGINQIRYGQGNIKETFGEVLATLKREFGGQ